MKQHFSLIFLFVLLFTLAACASKAEAPAMKATMAADVLVSSAAAVQEPYINEKLGFSFAIPDSWES